MSRFLQFLILLVFLLWSCQDKKNKQGEAVRWLATAPAGNEYCNIDHEGKTVIPNGRFLTPEGKQIAVAPHPFGLTLSPDGNTIITANSGTGPFSISVIKNFLDQPEVRQIPEGVKPDESMLESVFMGLAVSPDGEKVYVAGGQENKVYVFNLRSYKKIGEINCAVSFTGDNYEDGYIGDMVLSKDGNTLYAVDQIGFRLVIIDTRTNKVIKNVKTGRYPFGVALSRDERTVFVANVGMFEYSYVKSLDKMKLKETSLPYPAFAYGSEEMEKGIKNDTVEVEGLGEMNAPESFSVWFIDVSTNEPKVAAKIKTGILVGDKTEDIAAIGGSSPNSIAVGKDYIYVSNGNNDNISVIDIAKKEVTDTLELTLDNRLGYLKGLIPFGLTLTPDEKNLVVAEAGINAVAVVDLQEKKVLGHIPTGWFPSKVQITPDGKQIIVSNAKGWGSGPNGGKNFHAGPEGDYIGSLMKGTVSVIPFPSADQWASLTKRVVDNNFQFYTAGEKLNNPIPSYAGEQDSPIKYIVFISKENRTYDQVFGQLPSGKGDSSLAIYGKHVSFSNQKGDRSVEKATVMPNHLALANQFAISDNFYVDADVSADGHRWLTNTYPNEWMETHHPAAYGGKRSQKENSTAPGKFGMTGASGAIYPEDYNQHGSMWDHLARNNVEFYNFGFGVEFDAGSFADSTFKYGGVRYLVNYPLPGPLYDRTSRLFPTFNMAIPDQFRADIFIKEVKEKFLDGKKSFPPVLTLQLLNDHGARERAHAGFPFNESYMADNDLALGRVVEFLSHTPYWKNMLIVVTEDDAQGGNDHIDAHRSLLMIISPYAKKSFNSHQHYSFGSIFKTFWNILGIPYLNQYDFGSAGLNECFTSVPDYTPYNAVPVDKRIFDPEKALTPLHEKFDWEAARNSVELDDPDEIKKVREDEARKRVRH
jgi:YVTN family beta-propeller protein